MVIKEVKSNQDVEAGPCRASTANESDGTVCLSVAEDKHWHSPYSSNLVHECRLSRESSHEISGVQESCRNSCISDTSVELDLECGTQEIEVNVEKPHKDCRICHLSLECHARESGIPIVLGCSCKDDLAAAHKQCAETWFKIKGNKCIYGASWSVSCNGILQMESLRCIKSSSLNHYSHIYWLLIEVTFVSPLVTTLTQHAVLPMMLRTCEICGATAKNVIGTGGAEFIENWNETSNNSAPHAPQTETRSFWQGHRFLNFLLACMVFAFIISWLFHFNIPG